MVLTFDLQLEIIVLTSKVFLQFVDVKLYSVMVEAVFVAVTATACQHLVLESLRFLCFVSKISDRLLSLS